ncbi:hypothetical protein CMO90_02645 [Candidatus Woesearchaeota archaeon]|nr:hypothetical protein [Candidatus Woesearchaeota archaeon]|tara:strand:+ start:1209 stop:1871 length:663 start_codon:yes stop_codon:yes gene_type:complete
MEITLINSEHLSYESLPYGFGVIISALKKSNIKPFIIDYNFLRRFGNLEITFSTNEINKFLYSNILSERMIFFFEKISKEISTKIVCFSCFSFESLKQSLILAKYIKKLDSKKIIVFGGIGTFNHEHSLMKEFTFIDFIIMRKSEQQLCELINLLYENKDFSKISNLVYRNSNKHIRSNKLATYNIESQSSPDYDFYFDIKKDWDIQYMTSDGCVNKCAF